MAKTLDERRHALRVRLDATEREMLSWERSRVAAQTAEDRGRAVDQLAVLRRRWERDRARLDALRDQLVLPWFGTKEGKRAS